MKTEYTDVPGQLIGPVFKVVDISEPICCPETSVKNYHYMLRNSPEERSSHLLRGGSLKSRITTLYIVTYTAPLVRSNRREKKDRMSHMCVENLLSFMCNLIFCFVIFALSARFLNCWLVRKRVAQQYGKRVPVFNNAVSTQEKILYQLNIFSWSAIWAFWKRFLSPNYIWISCFLCLNHMSRSSK